MKIKSDMWPVTSDRYRQVRRNEMIASCHPSPVTRHSEKGIALVITLIMLSVTLVMAVAFLALSQRERKSVSTATDTTTARLAADSALAAAQAQIMANLLNTNTSRTANNGLYNFGLLVSTNYINTYGFNPAVGGVNPTNVNYDFTSDNSPYTAAEFVQNVANLQYLPRVPVFIVTNSQTGSNDFRYYLDLNRNGRFEDSGFVPDLEFNSGGSLVTNGFMTAAGDAQWIGVLARPDAPHSPNNQFVSRYAFFAMPVGNGLDINAIHNQVDNTGLGAADGFFRNQGVGSWEINLAAFLADLNTNQWLPTAPPNNGFYAYNLGNNAGVAFDDARSLLSYRYGFNYSSLAQASALFNNYNRLQNQPIDIFPFGALMTNATAFNYNNPGNNGWAGADNTNHYFDLPSDLFDTTKVSGSPSVVGFTNRLMAAGGGVSSYDRYTFYRLLSQLGTDSDPDAGKMNLNYSNVLVNYDAFGVATNMTVIPGAETNLFQWNPADFFTAAANRLLLSYTADWFADNPSNYLQTYYGIYGVNYTNLTANLINSPTGFGLTNFGLNLPAGLQTILNQTNQVPSFGVTNIPVYINGQFVYSPAVNRILQLALNMYDASTTNFYPSVFRPMFEHDDSGNVFIVGFTNVTSGPATALRNTVVGINDPQLSPPLDVTGMGGYGASYVPMSTNDANVNIYGVPWIIGAKKGFPNFNKFGMQSLVQITRKLQVTRSSIPTVVNSTTFLTNQLLAFSISNSINAECWNSYTNAYLNQVQIIARDTISMQLTNSTGPPNVFFYNYQLGSNLIVKPWPGYSSSNPTISFTNPLSGTATLLSNSVFYFGSLGPKGFFPVSYGYGWESNKYDFPFPQFDLLTTNRMQLYMLDEGPGGGGPYHVIDYVHFAGPQPALNITAAVTSNNATALGYGPNMWSTNANNSGTPYGILSQINASETPVTANEGTLYWTDDTKTQAQIDGFAAFMGLAWPYPNVDTQNPAIAQVLDSYATNYVAQAPYTPTVTLSQYTSWQANDPLVHNLASDLNFYGTENGSGIQTGTQAWYGAKGDVIHYPFYNTVNDRYQPWGKPATAKYQATALYNFANPYNLIYKDPLIWGSDYWSFPTNVYPTVGWLGRVHRGTPWQTVYLKADNVLHIGANAIGTNTWVAWTGDNDAFDAAQSAPIQDRILFDLFTTRLNDNAARGTLSVNTGAGSLNPLAGLADWSALFSGMVALTNANNFPKSINTDPKYADQYQAALKPAYNWMIIQPGGVSGLNSILGNLVTNINYARSNYVNADGVKGSFEHIGDMLSAPLLTQQSPFLNLSNYVQQEYAISDAAYEWLPQQMLGLLRVSRTPRYVIYCYGQALRPAPNGLVTAAGDNFGLVTNYQVVAESAVRAVMSVQPHVEMTSAGPVTNYTTQVESYNVLPPN